MKIYIHHRHWHTHTRIYIHTHTLLNIFTYIYLNTLCEKNCPTPSGKLYSYWISSVRYLQLRVYCDTLRTFDHVRVNLIHVTGSNTHFDPNAIAVRQSRFVNIICVLWMRIVFWCESLLEFPLEPCIGTHPQSFGYSDAGRYVYEYSTNIRTQSHVSLLRVEFSKTRQRPCTRTPGRTAYATCRFYLATVSAGVRRTAEIRPVIVFIVTVGEICEFECNYIKIKIHTNSRVLSNDKTVTTYLDVGHFQVTFKSYKLK